MTHARVVESAALPVVGEFGAAGEPGAPSLAQALSPGEWFASQLRQFEAW